MTVLCQTQRKWIFLYHTVWIISPCTLPLTLFAPSHFLKKIQLLIFPVTFYSQFPSSSSLGGAGGSFSPRSLCEAELFEQPCCRLSLHATDPPHTSYPAVARLPTGGFVQGAHPCVRGRKVVPAVVSSWAWTGPQAGLEQNRCLWPGGLGAYICNW